MTLPNIPDMLAHAITTRPASVWPTFEGGDLDRAAFLTASESMACLRELKFKKTHGEQRDGWGMMERGHAVEEWVVDRLEDALADVPDAKLEFYGFMQRSFVDREARLSGTPDGLLTFGSKRKTRWLLEIKSVDPRTNLESWDRPKPQHEAQVQQNMHLMQKAGFPVKAAVVFYIDASNFQRSRQFEVVFDRKAADRFATRAANLFSAAEAADLPAEGLTNGGCTYCQFTAQCSAIQQAKNAPSPAASKAPPTLPDFAPRGIADTIRAYAEVNTERKSLEEREKELGNKIKAYAQQENESVLTTGRYIAEVKEVAGRKTLDVAAYEAATKVPAEDFYKVGKPSLRLEVKTVDN